MKRRGFFGAIVGLLAAPFVPAVAAYPSGKRYTETFHMDDVIECVFDPSTGATEYTKNGVVLPAATMGTVFVVKNHGTTPLTVLPAGVELKHGETLWVK